MAQFIYGESRGAQFDERVLAHLQVVILNKLRRRESFAFSWEEPRGFVSIWVHPSVALQFIYSGNRAPSLNRAWLELLAESANSTGGLHPLPEPPADAVFEVYADRTAPTTASTVASSAGSPASSKR